MSTRADDGLPTEIRWCGIILRKSEYTAGSEVARYEALVGQDVQLWKWNSNQWGAKIDGASYSVEDSWDEALRSAALKAIDYHEHRRHALFGMLDRWGDGE